MTAITRHAPIPAWLLPLALCLMLLATWYVHLPMMLWDHIDLVPIYDAWQRDALSASQFWAIHDGSHFHSAAYAVLLLTTALSGGKPWLDCIAAWGFYAVFALTLWRLVGIGWQTTQPARGWWWAMLLLIAHPGHLANLQWGWQVAVFISLLGAVLPILVLCSARPTHLLNLLAVVLAVVGVLGFSTTLVAFPIAVALIAVRGEWTWLRRFAFALPWCVAGSGTVAWLLHARGQGVAAPDVGVLLHYALNYPGGGVLRFAEDLAPWWAGLALLLVLPMAYRCRQRAHARVWLALMAFAVGCALLTALGRAGPFGAEHALVSRYASFALLFWIGWLGLAVTAMAGEAGLRRWLRPLLIATLVFAAANGLHLAKKAWSLHQRASTYAAVVRSTYPNVDAATMEQAYGDRAGLAQERLGLLKAWGFAPFDAAADD